MPISRSPSPDSRFGFLSRSFGNIFSHTGNETNDDIINPTTPPRTGVLQSFFQDVTSQGNRIGADISLLASLLDIEKNGGLVDDRKYQMESVIQLAASLPKSSKSLNDLTGKLIRNLWENLHHPPLSYMGDEFRYRQADGSNNNIMYPALGKAGSPYARTVTPKTLVPGARPDAATVFDALFARSEVKEHPSKISSTLFHFASIIIHDIFRTDDVRPGRMRNSSYLDLSPLYGCSEDEVKSVRSLKGDGTLKPDAFAETRLLAFPPGVATLLVCFNRFHNYIAQQLAIINEGERFNLDEDAKDKPEDKRFQKRDNDLFQTARLITCGLYVNIILNDYVRVILNLNRSNSDWTLDPRKSFEEVYASDGTPSGVGNVVSVEFNLIYRWHSTMSVTDDEWTQNFYKKLFPDVKDPSSITKQQLCNGMKEWLKELDSDPGKRSFYDQDMKELQRDPKTGAFNDEELVNILTNSTKDIAGAFGARNVPVVMKLIEVLGIEQARKWQVATLNEFRKFFKLQPYTKFSEINSDKSVQESLRTLYGKPDYVELYPGIVAEEPKITMKPGSGLCPGFTLSRTILADAVALTRGDRFYTVDYSPANLTNWGFQQANNNAEIANGCVIYKLIMRAFPKWYRASSVYAMFPFVVPEENRHILENLGREKDFDFAEPSKADEPVQISTWEGVTSVLANKDKFKVPWGEHTTYLTGHDYMLSYDTDNEVTQREFVHKALYCPSHALREVQDFYEFSTMELVKAHSHELTPNVFQLDAVKDVGNISHSIFVAKMFHIPLKTPESWIPDITASQLYQILAGLFAYVFLDADPASSMFLRDAAKDAVDKLGKLVKLVCTAVKMGNYLMPLDLSDFFGRRRQTETAQHLLGDYGVNMIRRLFKGGKSVDEVVWTIIPTAAAAVATQAQGWAQLLDLYLSQPYQHHWKHIMELSLSDNPKDFDLLIRYGLEGYRLATPSFGLLRKAATDAIIHDGKNGPVQVSEGQQIYTNFVSAGRDPEKFPHPEKIDLERPMDAYIHHGFGPHSCLGRNIVQVAMAAQLRVFGRMKNLRRAPGRQGELKFQNIEGIIKVYMKEDWSDWYPFPTTMKVHFDELIDPNMEAKQSFLRVRVDDPRDRGVPPSPADSGIGFLGTPGLKRTFTNVDGDVEEIGMSGSGSESEGSRGRSRKKTRK